MANRRDFYFRQKVTEAELDVAFAELENADRALASDLGLVGVAVGMTVAQQLVPNLTVQVSGPGVVYDQVGQRIAIPSTQNVNCAVDESSLNTAVVTPGNSRILSIFAEFDRTLSDPRVDGNSATVFFVRAESFQFNVAAGAEAGAPTAPPLRGDQILLADITLVFGQTQIVNADISTSRREWMFKTTSGTAIAVGTAEEAIQALATAVGADVTALAAHLADAVDAHDASAISFAPTGLIAATDVQSALAELDAEKLALAGGSMSGDIDMNTNDLLDVGTLQANGVVAGSSFDFIGGMISKTRSIPLVPHLVEGSGWLPDDTLHGEWITDGAIFDNPIFFDLLPFLPHGCEFQSVSVVWEQTAGFGAVGDQMSGRLLRHQMNFTTGAETIIEPVGFAIAYGAGTGIKINNGLNPADFTIDRETTAASDTALWLRIESAVGGVSRIKAIRMTYREPGPRIN